MARIFVLDDEEPIRKILSRALTRAGYEVITVGTIEEAFRALDQEEFDLYLCDMMMPEGPTAGLEFMNTIRQKAPQAPVIMVTGVDDPHAAELAQDLGAFAYIIKAYNTNELLVTIRSALLHKQMALDLSAGAWEKKVGELTVRAETAESELAALKENADAMAASLNRSFETTHQEHEAQISMLAEVASQQNAVLQGILDELSSHELEIAWGGDDLYETIESAINAYQEYLNG